jgi:hypothetical protein
MGDAKEIAAVLEKLERVLHRLEMVEAGLAQVEAKVDRAYSQWVPAFRETPAPQCEHCYCIPTNPGGTSTHYRCCHCGHTKAYHQWA